MNVRVINYLAVAILVAVVAFFGGKLLGQTTSKVATVNITQVIAEQQQRSIKDLVDGAGDEDKRKLALQTAEAFGKRVSDEVVALSQECGCLILMKEAVVAGNAEDLTDRLVDRLSQGQR